MSTDYAKEEERESWKWVYRKKEGRKEEARKSRDRLETDTEEKSWAAGGNIDRA